MELDNISATEAAPIELLKYPFPYQAAFTVASDIDSASILRFRAVHALFCGKEVIAEGSPEWRVLGLRVDSPRFDRNRAGIVGLGLALSDSFFMVGDATTFGMYRYSLQRKCFEEDVQDGENCATLVQSWIKEGQIDTFHTFLHHTRLQLEPLLKGFYGWCERDGVRKPRVWINHSTTTAPTGLCPERLQPGWPYRLARFSSRAVSSVLSSKKRLPLRYVFTGYQGAKPGSVYYINDLLAANGLRYVWLNMADAHRNQIALPEREHNGRSTILQPVTMDDGIRYWRFERSYGCYPEDRRGEGYLRDSAEGCDVSHLITEKNLSELCNRGGSCILYTHWTHPRSMPIANETIARFELLQRWRDEGKIWVAPTAQLLEWTRVRTFLRIVCRREAKRLIVEMGGVEDPLLGHEAITLERLNGLSFRLRQTEPCVVVTINGRALSPEQVRRERNLCWLDVGAGSARAARNSSLTSAASLTSSCSSAP